LIRFFAQLIKGHYRQHRLEGLLCLLGVALGVAVVVGIDAAVNACVQSFGGAVQSLAERSTHSIFAEDGTIPDETYIELRKKGLPFPLAPVIDRGVLASSSSGTDIVARLIGVDAFSERSLRSYTKMQSSLDSAAFEKFLTEPDQVVLVDSLAAQLHVSAGSSLQLTVGSRRIMVHVTGIVQPTGVARSQLTDLIICDLATAQELTGAIGRIDRIDTILESPEHEHALESQLPAGLVLRSTRQQSSSLSELIRSYKLNLNALSLMASFVAIFIVYNSMLISVQQRASSLGILRCLGGSRSQLGAIYFVEAILFALVGGAIGVLGGWLLSRSLVGLVATTINDLYATVRPGPVPLDRSMWLRGLATSTVSCLVGALIPLYQASRVPPVNAFRGTSRTRASGVAANWLLLAGAVLLAISFGVYRLPGNSPIAGFAMALLIALGFAFMCPWITRLASKGIDLVSRPAQLLPLQMAASGVSRSLGITGVAVAAMMLAMSMNVSVRTMVSSFRGALGHWMEQRFSADVFIGPELTVNHKIDATLDPAIEKWMLRQPQVASVIEYRLRNIDWNGKPILLVGTDINALLATLPIKVELHGRGSFDPATDALISEPLAGRAKLGLGDSLEMNTPAGIRHFRVFAIFYDFGSERGQIMLDRHTYASNWRDGSISSLHVRLLPGSDRRETAARWSPILRKDYPVVVNSFDGVKTEVLAVFDRTFKVTSVLTWLAGGVAFCGLAGSLLALALARRRDYSILAAVGMSARQTALWVLAQGLLIAWTAALIASVAGSVLAYVLAYVIQYRSFGWSIPTSPQPRFWVENIVLATIAATVAAIYPIYRLRTAAPAGSLRQE
jgi:putative ABC transport system permease protein